MLYYNWQLATGSDVQEIVNLSMTYHNDIDAFLTPDPICGSRNITHAIVNQFYLPNTELVLVCRPDDKLYAFTWCNIGTGEPFSDEKLIDVRMATVDLSLPTKSKVKLLFDMMTLWEDFAIKNDIKLISSNTVRDEQTAFLKLHEKRGYIVKGSFAFKMLNTTQATPAN